ncbi:MAG: hypothetical protein WB987_12745 [Candidatus Acidiferrales bacterium]
MTMNYEGDGHRRDSRRVSHSRAGNRVAGLALLIALGVAAAAAVVWSATGAFAPDKGKFKILVNGQQAGTEEFALSASGGNWVARGHAEIQTPQGAAHVTGTLELKPDGAPVRYEWSMQGAKKAGSTIVFNGATANVELRMEGARPYTQQFTFTSDRVVVLDNNMYDQYAILARLYDWDKKGAQTFSVIVPQEMTPGTVTVESLGKQDTGGGAKLDELRVKTEDLEIDLFLDGQRLVRLVSPSANAEIIRE